MNYKTILGGASAVLCGAALYKYGVQDLGGAGQGYLEQLFAPIGHTINIMFYGGDRWMYAIPGAVELAGLAGIAAGWVGKKGDGT